jgi:hypothetical protein
MATVAIAASATAQQTPPPPQNTPPPAPSYNDLHPNANFASEYDLKGKNGYGNQRQEKTSSAQDVAACLVSESREKAGALLGGPMTDDETFKRLTRSLTHERRNCAPETAAIPLIYINGALAEELIRRERPALAIHATPADLGAAKAFYTGLNGVTMDSLGRCLAVYSPGLAYAVVFTPAQSALEKQAMARLYAETPQCSVQVAPSNIPANEQRAAVAAGLYHWTHRR